VSRRSENSIILIYQIGFRYYYYYLLQLNFRSVAVVLTLVQNLNVSEDIKIGIGNTMKRISKPQLKRT